MPTFNGFAAFNRELDAMSKEISVAKRRKITGPMAEQAQKIAAGELPRDLGGDDAFSGWAAKPTTEIKFTSTGAAVLHPTKTSAGPWTVLEHGRNQAAGPAFTANLGPRLTQTGRLSRRKVKRWNGRTVGKGTASRAVAQMEKLIPKVAEDGVRRVQMRHFDVT